MTAFRRLAEWMERVESRLGKLENPPSPPVPAAKLTHEEAKKLMAESTVDSWFGGSAPLFEQKKCQHCGGLHVRKCPAVKEIEFYEDGKVKQVVYFARGEWSDDDVIWLEDVIAALEGGDGDGE